MDYLNSVFELWLLMLTNFVNDDRLGAILWVFVLVMTLLLTIKIWRGVASWKHS